MTDIELEIISLMAAGWTSKQIARTTKYADTSIDTFRAKMIKKYKVRNTAHLIAYCYDNQILKPLNGNKNESESNQGNKVRQAQFIRKYQLCH